ncbi:MAG: STAS domain-containing protein [Planctomycetota bacterium]|jgi:anti-anti-sigma factor
MSEFKEIKIGVSDEMVLAELQCSDMDEKHTTDMQEKLSAISEESEQLVMVLDMSKVEFMPSLSIGALISVMQNLKMKGQRFILAGLQLKVRETLTACRLDKLFEIFDSVDDVRANISEQA